MTIWILLGIASIMYLEGLLLATAVGKLIKPSKWVWPILLLLWPVALPMLGYKTLMKYRPLLMEIQQNPFLKSMMGGMGSTESTPQDTNPFAALMGQMPSPQAEMQNPFAALLGQGPQSPVAAILGSTPQTQPQKTEELELTEVSENKEASDENQGDRLQ